MSLHVSTKFCRERAAGLMKQTRRRERYFLSNRLRFSRAIITSNFQSLNLDALILCESRYTFPAGG